ncbi:hypothetical protein HMPREF2852_02785 [Anaerococcus sp. HMSC065G05]|nr:hypothetical protein HMPREF2852_02785 [Anaerococcus sp. HMSC065G05]
MKSFNKSKIFNKKIFNIIKNNRKALYFSLFVFTYFSMAFIYLIIEDFVLSKILCIFLGIMSLFFLNKTYIIPKKSQFILKSILIIFISLSFLSLFLV